MTKHLTPLQDMGRFATIVVDPPWPLKPLGLSIPAPGRSYRYKELPYSTMSIKEIKDLPVPQVLQDDAFIFLWTVNKFVLQSQEILENWGAGFSFLMTWVKSKGMQTPLTPCFNSEFIAVGRRGSPTWSEIKDFRTGNFWERSHHSEKPEAFYDLLRRITPGPRLDIFGRRRIAGFTSWGDEAPEGEPPPEHYQQVLLDIPQIPG